MKGLKKCYKSCENRNIDIEHETYDKKDFDPSLLKSMSSIFYFWYSTNKSSISHMKTCLISVFGYHGATESQEGIKV